MVPTKCIFGPKQGPHIQTINQKVFLKTWERMLKKKEEKGRLLSEFQMLLDATNDRKKLHHGAN